MLHLLINNNTITKDKMKDNNKITIISHKYTSFFDININDVLNQLNEKNKTTYQITDIKTFFMKYATTVTIKFTDNKILTTTICTDNFESDYKRADELTLLSADGNNVHYIEDCSVEDFQEIYNRDYSE